MSAGALHFCHYNFMQVHSALCLQKINQEEAAERCGLHRTYYSGVERGIRNVSLVNIEKIAKGLRKSLSDLFSRV
jgi:transcriptional regulator with XRE-family HTH domain